MNPTRRIGASRLAGFAGTLVLSMPAVTLACVPALGPPPTPEEAAAMQAAAELESQQDLWRRADHVFLARPYDSYAQTLEVWEARLKVAQERRPGSRRPQMIPPVPPPPLIYMLGEGKTVVTVEPLTALKGTQPPRRFELRDQAGWTSCGPLHQFDIFSPERDDSLFVVFVAGPYPTQDGVLEAIAVEKIVAPGIRAALDGVGQTP